MKSEVWGRVVDEIDYNLKTADTAMCSCFVDLEVIEEYLRECDFDDMLKDAKVVIQCFERLCVLLDKLKIFEK